MALFSAPRNFTDALISALFATIGVFVQISLILLWFVAAKNITHGFVGLFSNNPRHGAFADRLGVGIFLVAIATGLHYANIIHDREIFDEVAAILGVLLGLGVDQRLKRIW